MITILTDKLDNVINKNVTNIVLILITKRQYVLYFHNAF